MNDRRSTDLQFETPIPASALALKSAGLGTWQLNPSAKTLSCSPECKAHFGYDADQDFTYQDWADAVHPEDRDSWARAVQEASHDAGTFELAYRTILPDRRIRWVLMRGEHILMDCQPVVAGVSCDADCLARVALSPGSEQRFRAAFHEAPVLLAILDVDGTVLEVNRTSCGASGFTERQFRGRPLWESPWWQSLPEEATELQTQMAEAAVGRALQSDCAYQVASGEVRYASRSLSPVRDRTGRISHIIALGFDITERKKSSDQLHLTQERLLLAQKAGSLGTFDWDIKNNVNLWSEEIEDLYGLEPGAFGTGTYEKWLELIVPEDRHHAEAAMQNSLKTGTLQGEWRILRPSDGQIHWLQARGKVLYDRNGRPERMIGVNADITEQKRAAATRHESEERFRFTFEEAALGMAHVGLDGRWLRINRKLCEIVGYTREELLYMTFQDITYPDDLEADLAHVKELLEGKVGRYSMEKRYIRKDGSLVWVNLTASLLRDSDGDPKYFISVVEDITARKQMEEALARSYSELESQVAQRTSALRSLSNRLMQLQDEERRRIARELHDSVGQYLTALAINLDLLARPDGQSRTALIAESRQLLNHCLTETRTMSHLLHPPLLDETGFTSAAQWYVEGFARRSGVEVELRLPPLERLPANIEIMLFRVLQETLNNIHRHSGSGKAEVCLDFDGKTVTFEVRDFGHGIQPDRLERFRTSGTGVGVGLAGIRERVSELGGKMEITSDRNGTAVKVCVPAYGASAGFTPIAAAS
jgi:two-component system sensor histidine kinase UhpB